MSDLAIWVLATLEVVGLAGLFVYIRAQVRRRETGLERPPRAVRISVALLGLAVAVVFPVLMITSIINQGTRGERQRDEIVQSGTPATGVITHVEETGKVVNHRPEVRVYVTVEPAGAASFPSTATWVFSVSDVQSYRVGTRVAVFFKPDDRRAVAVVGVAPTPSGP
jgi:hypothetical protein